MLRYPHVEKGHLLSLLKQLLITSSPSRTISDSGALGAADVPSLLGTGVFSLLESMLISLLYYLFRIFMLFVVF